MPSLLTHSFFAEDFLLRHTGESNFLEANKDAFLLGSQGPDPLFFYGIWPKRGLHLNVAMDKIGNKLHSMDGTKLFYLCFQQWDKMLIPFSKDVFASFVFGQLAHYLLDSSCHPYVLFFSGFDKKAKGIKGKYHYRHAHFEARIDSTLSIDRAQMKLIKRPGDVLSVEEDKMGVISENFTAVLEGIKGGKLPKNMYADAVKNGREVCFMVNSAHKLKDAMIMASPLNKLFIPRDPLGDVMNNGHQTWENPCTGERHSESF